MREDMSRVIVERPRRDGGDFHRGRARDPEELPRQEGMRRRHVLLKQGKYFNENLAPLRRYLERQLGRPWDKVYSEIARHLRTDSTVQQHVRDHLADFVAIKPRRDVNTFRWRRGWPWHQPFYVDPADGILKRTDRLPEVRRQQASDVVDPRQVIRTAPGRELRNLDGIWHEVTTKPLPQPRYRDGSGVWLLDSPPVLDVASGRRRPLGPPIDDAGAWAKFRREYPEISYAVAKRVLDPGELRRYRLANSF